MYKIGEKVVYPMHGAGTIEGVEEREILGERKEFFVLNVSHGNMTIMIPTDKCDEIGIRYIIKAKEVDDVMAVLAADSTPMPTNWNHRNRENMEKLKTGAIHQVAEVVRNLARVEEDKHLSTSEKKMLTNAKQILTSEIILAMGIGQEEADHMVEDAIAG